MRNNDINDEDFGKEIPEPTVIKVPAVLVAFGFIILGCVASIIVALTIRFDRWLVR